MISSSQALPESPGEKLARCSPVDLAPWVLVPREGAPECHSNGGHVTDIGPSSMPRGLTAPQVQGGLGAGPLSFQARALNQVVTDTEEVWCFSDSSPSQRASLAQPKGKDRGLWLRREEMS